jgi:hypothetical protein
MPPASTQPLSVAELLELPSDSWVNDGFTATVVQIERKMSQKTQKPFWKCKLQDTTGSACVNLTMFRAPKFSEGQQVDFVGAGIKFKDGQYGQEVSISDKTEIHVVGQSAHHEEQQERASNLQPAVNGSSPQIAGVSVGCALNQAWETVRAIYTPEELKAKLSTEGFWAQLKQISSDHLRVAAALEHGKVSAPSWKQDERPEPRRESPPARQAERRPASSLTPEEEDVPF